MEEKEVKFKFMWSDGPGESGGKSELWLLSKSCPDHGFVRRHEQWTLEGSKLKKKNSWILNIVNIK